MQQNNPLKVWTYLYQKHRIVRDALFEAPYSDILDGMLERACKHYDISVPLVLTKHEKELADFSRTAFSPGDFIDSFPYDSFVLEILRDPDKKLSKKSMYAEL